MTRTAFPLLALLCAFTAAAPAQAAERSYSVTDFERIQVEGSFEVALVTGRPAAARATGSAQALDRVTVEVQAGILHIRPNRSAWSGYPGDKTGPLRIEVSTRDLRTATVIGAGHLSIDRVRGLRADLSLSGSGRIDVARIEADVLNLTVLGAGRIAAAGAAKQVRAATQGSAELAAAGLTADDLVLTSETAGNVAIAARRTAKVRQTGSGVVAVGGSPSCTVTASGAGEVRCGR